MRYHIYDEHLMLYLLDGGPLGVRMQHSLPTRTDYE